MDVSDYWECYGYFCLGFFDFFEVSEDWDYVGFEVLDDLFCLVVRGFFTKDFS